MNKQKKTHDLFDIECNERFVIVFVIGSDKFDL